MKVIEERPNYYAIIPAEIRYDEDLKDKAKLLYGEIAALSDRYGKCFASNRYFANLYKVDISTISRLIKNLSDKGYIEITYIYKENTKEIENRYMQICKGVVQNCNGGICKIAIDNNTSNNNIKESNNINIITKERFKKPTLEEVENYCKERNNGINAEIFIDFYESKGWMVGKNKMKDWKAAVRNWERNRKDAKKQIIPKWFNENNEVAETTEEDIKEMENILNGIWS